MPPLWSGGETICVVSCERLEKAVGYAANLDAGEGGDELNREDRLFALLLLMTGRTPSARDVADRAGFTLAEIDPLQPHDA